MTQTLNLIHIRILYGKVACKFTLSLKFFILKRTKFQNGFDNIYVVVNFLSQLIFIFPLLLGMLIYANEFKTKENKN